jgi:CheY-like chemotaxis protein
MILPATSPGHRKGSTVPRQNGRQPHLLVINDTPEILALFAELLGGEGYRVTIDRFTVETNRMLAEVKQTAPDLILLDFIIGDEQKGWQFLQLLKMDRETRALPLIVCTAAVGIVKELQPHLDEMGVHVVLKPFDIDHLLTVVAAVLAHPGGPVGP